MYRPFNCADCGDPLSAKEVGYEVPLYVEGTARTRVRRVVRFCRDCHAASEYKAHQARQATDEQRLARSARKLVEQGQFKSLREAVEFLEAPL